MLHSNMPLDFNRLPIGHTLNSFRVKSPLIIE
jgi:hypothetical protein